MFTHVELDRHSDALRSHSSISEGRFIIHSTTGEGIKQTTLSILTRAVESIAVQFIASVTGAAKVPLIVSTSVFTSSITREALIIVCLHREHDEFLLTCVYVNNNDDLFAGGLALYTHPHRRSHCYEVCTLPCSNSRSCPQCCCNLGYTHHFYPSTHSHLHNTQ